MKKLNHNTEFKSSDLFEVVHIVGNRSKFTGSLVGYLGAENSKRHKGDMISVRILSGEHKDKIAEIRAANLKAVSVKTRDESELDGLVGFIGSVNSWTEYYKDADRFLVTNKNGSQRFVEYDTWVDEVQASYELYEEVKPSIISKIRELFS